MTRALIDDAEHWRSCAEEARAVAGELRDPEVKRIMEEIASNFEELARRAEERRVGSAKKPIAIGPG